MMPALPVRMPARALFLAGAVLLAASGAAAQGPVLASSKQPSPPSSDAVVTLSASDLTVGEVTLTARSLLKRARYQPGDSLAWADPDFDDSDWPLVDPLLPGRDAAQPWPGIGWFRVRLVVDSSLAQFPVGFSVRHLGAIEVYLDGQLIERIGTVAGVPEVEEDLVDQAPFPVPLTAPGTYALAIRYSNHDADDFWARGGAAGFEIWWGNVETMTQRWSSFRSARRFHQGLLGGLLVGLALFHVLLYAFYARFRPNLHVGLLAGVAGVFALLTLQVGLQRDPDALLLITRIHRVLWAALLLVTLRFFHGLVYERLPGASRALPVAAAVLAVAGWIWPYAALGAFVGATLLVLVEVARALVRLIRRGDRWAWLMAVGLGLLLVLGLQQQLALLGVVQGEEGWAGRVPSAFYGFLGFLLAASFYVTARFGREAHRLAVGALRLEAERRAHEEESATLEAQLAETAAALDEARGDVERTKEQLVQSRTLASLGQLTAGVAHEVKNPLNFVNNFARLSIDLAQELREELESRRSEPVEAVLPDVEEILGDLARNAERINEHGRRADEIIRNMLLHSRGGAGPRRPANLNALLNEYAGFAYHGLRATDPHFQATLEKNLDPAVGEVEVAPQEMGRVFINLLQNAFQAVQQKALAAADGYEPTVRIETRALGDEVVIRVADNGPGIPADLLEHVFEPFFTTKPAGTGLGLALSHDIVAKGHGGRIEVESAEGEGTAFTVTLPRRGADGGS